MYLAVLRLAANSAAAPASRAEEFKYETALVQTTVTSQTAGLPARHGMSVTPSGRFPSARLRTTGSLDTGMPAATYLDAAVSNNINNNIGIDNIK